MSDSNDDSPPEGPPLQDDGFEFVDGTASQSSYAPTDGDQEPCWYTASHGVTASTPVSLAEILQRLAEGSLRANDLVWKQGQAKWLPISDVVPVESLPPVNSPVKSQSPDFPTTPSSNEPSAWQRLINSVGNWTPTAFLYRLIARIILALGLLIFIYSVFLFPFGMSWFGGSLMLLILASIIELTSVLREKTEP